MSDSKMYNILGIFKGLNDNAKTEQLNESVKQPTVYETVEPKGSIMEAVKSLESKYTEFKEGIEDKIEAAREKAAAKGKIKDTAKEEPKSASRFVKGRSYGGSAQKDAEEKDDLDEGQGPYELYNPKHPKFKANYDKWMAKNPGKTLSDFIDAMKKREHGNVEEATSSTGGEIIRKGNVTTHKANKYGGSETNSNAKEELGRKNIWDLKRPGKPVDLGEPDEVDEVAPPGAKAERMVKGIKKSLSKDGHLSGKDKAIAYATTWKAHNKGQVEEGRPSAADKVTKDLTSLADKKGYKSKKDFTSADWDEVAKPHGFTGKEVAAVRGHKFKEGTNFGDTVKNSSTKFTKAKAAKLKEGRDMSKSQYFDEQVALALAEEQPGLDTSSPKFNEAVYNEIIAQGMTAKAARNIMLLDEDFLGDVATAYGYFCKHNDEVAAHAQGSMQEPIDAVQEPVDAMQELDEIAKLAGLTNEMDSKVPADSDSPLTHAGCPICEMDPCGCSHEDDVEEGNAFTGKLAATPKGGNFKLGDKAYKDTSSLEEEEMEEGNEFSGALAAAKASGAKEFEVDGKRYTVKEDITLTADGEDVINLFRKLSGLDPVASPVDVAQPVQPDAGVQVVPDIQDVIAGQEEVAEDESDPKQRDIEYVNTPREEQAGAEAAFPSGTDLNRAKRMYKRASPGDNPMAVKEAALWEKYESMIRDIKK
jgi:hypothetical protein